MSQMTVGDLKISKEVPKGNHSDSGPRRLACLLFSLILAGWGGLAAAIPVSIAWEVPLARTEVYNLEIAKDPGFSQIVVSQRVRGTGIVWQAKDEGVYHWRLTRASQQGAEASSFVSGTFVALDGAAMRAKPARLVWDPIPGADRYKLYVVEESGKSSTIIVQTNSFIVPKSQSSQTVEVVPYSGDLRTFRTFHFNPSLKLDTGVPPPPPPAPVVEQPPVTAPPPAATVAETTPAKAAPPPPVEQLPEIPGNRRVHLVYLFGLYEAEELRLQKLEVDLKSEKKSGGEGAGFWINPVRGLVVSAQGSYHEHNNRVEQNEVFGDQEIEVYQARYSADLSVGYNVLDIWGVKSQVLSFGVAAAAAQLPVLPLIYSSSPATELPRLGKRQLSLFGGSASYGYLGTRMAAVLEGGLALDKTDDAQLAYQRLMFDFYPIGKLSIQLGFFNRFSQFSRCAPDSGTCLLEGKVTTTSKERGGMLGFGVVLF